MLQELQQLGFGVPLESFADLAEDVQGGFEELQLGAAGGKGFVHLVLLGFLEVGTLAAPPHH